MLMTAWFVKVMSPPRNIGVAVEWVLVQRERWLCGGRSRAAGLGSGEHAPLGSLSPCSPGAGMRISASLALDLCTSLPVAALEYSAQPPTPESALLVIRWQVTWNGQSRTSGRDVTRHTNELQHHSLEKTTRKADFLFATLKQKFSVTSQKFQPLCRLFSPLGTCSLSAAERVPLCNRRQLHSAF